MTDYHQDLQEGSPAVSVTLFHLVQGLTNGFSRDLRLEAGLCWIVLSLQEVGTLDSYEFV